MTIGTRCLTQVSMSCISRSLEAWQIWLTAYGATFFSGCSALYSPSSFSIRLSHSESFSTGRAFSAGNEPTTPALHWAITSSGPETINSGEPTTGSSSVSTSEAGNGIRFLPLQRKAGGARNASINVDLRTSGRGRAAGRALLVGVQYRAGRQTLAVQY